MFKIALLLGVVGMAFSIRPTRSAGAKGIVVCNGNSYKDALVQMYDKDRKF